MAQASPDVVGRYEICRNIGGGGMGVLYLARDPAIDRLVAIKLLRDGLDSSDLRERFAREARSAGKLHHPNIVTIFDVGDHEGQPFIAMEYIRGETLADLIGRRAATSLIRKLEWMEDLCAGLHYAHRLGVIHRDIKPANVMVNEEGVLKLLDFGIARIGSTGITQGIIGTLNYMAPEQMEGRPLDARADIFSVGTLFYELLSYRRAFPGGLTDGVLTKILSKSPEPLEEIVTGLDPQLVAIVNRCLEKEPANRYADCALLARDIATVRLRLQYANADRREPFAGRTVPETSAIETPKPETPKRARQRVELLRIRTEQIRAHLALAHAAMEKEAYEDAVRECERALVLDPEHPEASTLSDQARSALERQQIERWIAEGHDQLARGAVTAASLLVDRALSLNSSSPEAAALRQAVDDARRQLAQAQERTRRIEEALAAAQRYLDAGALERAAALVAQALAIDATHESALALQTRIASAVDAKRRADEDTRAAAAVAQARQAFAAGDHGTAIGQLKAFRPDHPLVASTLAELEVEAREIARRAEIQREIARRAEIQQRADAAPPRREAEQQIQDAPTVRLQYQQGQVVPKRSRLGRGQLIASALAVVCIVGLPVLWRAPWRSHSEPLPITVPTTDVRTTNPAPAASPAAATSRVEPVVVPAPPPATSAPVSSDQPKASGSIAAENGAKTKAMADARAALDQKRYGLAVRVYEKLAKQFANDPSVRRALATARSVDAQQAAKAKDLVAQGDRAVQARQYDEALRLYQSAIAEYPEDTNAIGRVNDTNAAKARAEAVAAEILRRPAAPAQNTPALSDEQRAKLLAQADALVDARLLDAAIAIFDQVLAVEPDNNAAKQGKAKALALKAPKR